jgi:hypothetical protein
MDQHFKTFYGRKYFRRIVSLRVYTSKLFLTKSTISWDKNKQQTTGFSAT